MREKGARSSAASSLSIRDFGIARGSRSSGTELGVSRGRYSARRKTTEKLFQKTPYTFYFSFVQVLFHLIFCFII